MNFKSVTYSKLTVTFIEAEIQNIVSIALRTTTSRCLRPIYELHVHRRGFLGT